MHTTATAEQYGSAAAVRADLGRLAGKEAMPVVCTAVILTGMLFEIPPAVADMLLIFSGCFAAASVLIALAARRPEELSGFPGLVGGAVCLHLAAAVTAVRHVILSDGQAGAIATALAERLGDISGAVSAPVFVVTAGLSLIAMLSAASNIRVRAAADIAAMGEILTPNDDRAAARAAFNVGMGWAAKYIVLDALMTVLLVCIGVGAAAAGQLVRTFGGAGARAGYLAPAVGTGVVVLMPAMVLAAGASRLMVRNLVSAKSQPAARPAGGHKAAAGAPADQPAVEAECTVKEAVFDESSSARAEREYTVMAGKLCRGPARDARVVLMAAASPSEMGVTLPVNVAARIARAKRRCLVVGMDASRDALAKVFGTGAGRGPVKTCIKGLYVWSARSFYKGSASPAEKLKAVQKHFDKVIIYWPEAAGRHDRLAGIAGAAVLFGRHTAEMKSLEAELTTRGCIVMQGLQQS